MPYATSTPKPKPTTSVQPAKLTPTHLILTNKITPKGPPVCIATTLNDAICQNIELQHVYFEEWKRRLAKIEKEFLTPLKEAPLMNETMIVSKSLVKLPYTYLVVFQTLVLGLICFGCVCE